MTMTDSSAPPQSAPPSSAEAPAPDAAGAVIRPNPVVPEPVTHQDIVDVVQAAVRKAKEGDMYGAEVVRRYWKSRRETLVLDIGETRTAAELAEAQGRVLALAFAGAITPREGRDVSTMLENRRKALHTLDQQRDLEELVEFAKRQRADARTKGRR
jgi:hypothetical protein